MAGLLEQLAKAEKKAEVSSSVGDSSMGIGVGDFDVVLEVSVGGGAGDGGGVGDTEALKSSDCKAEKLLFLPIKSMLFTGAYGTSLTPVGITQ